jgi:hypothetical protein
LFNYLNRVAYRFSASNRERKWRRFAETFAAEPSWLAIDVGFSPGGSVVSDNLFEKRYPYTTQITALTIAEIGSAHERYPDINIVKYDGTTMPFDDRHFDVLWSNAVVEHVGGEDRQVDFLREIDRVAQRHFVTTPNRWFPFEVHTKLPIVHYLPKALFDPIARRLGFGWATGGYMNLLSKRQFKRRLRLAGIRDVRIISNRVWGIPVDFVAVW